MKCEKFGRIATLKMRTTCKNIRDVHDKIMITSFVVRISVYRFLDPFLDRSTDKNMKFHKYPQSMV